MTNEKHFMNINSILNNQFSDISARLADLLADVNYNHLAVNCYKDSDGDEYVKFTYTLLSNKEYMNAVEIDFLTKANFDDIIAPLYDDNKIVVEFECEVM